MVKCDHCGEEVKEEHATECKDYEHNYSWYYCLACDLGFTMAAARNAGVGISMTREQVKFMCDAIRKVSKEDC
jgi:hypothetical protein